MFFIDHTQLQTFKDCPRKYYNRFILGLQKIKYEESQVNLEFGKAIHGALAILYTDKDIGKAKDYFKDNFHGLEGLKVKTPSNGLQLLDWYYNYYQAPTNQLSDTNLETVGVEVKDTIQLTPDITYIVKIDRVVKSTSGIWVMEHKTTTQIPNNYFYQFDPNSQITGYCYYILQKYGQCSGCIINAMAMGYRERAYRNNPAGFHVKFVRDIVNRNKQQLEDWRKHIIGWCARLEWTKQNNLWVKNEGSCHKFKGCQYKDLCISCNDEQVKETLYVVEANPLAYLDD